MTDIAFIGLGAMGSRMAMNLHQGGFKLRVYNRDRAKAKPFAEKGIEVAGSPAEAAKGAGFVVSIVADDAATREVMLGAQGALASLSKGTVIVDSSTIAPPIAQRLATRARELGADGALVVGTSETASGPTAFVWDAVRGIRVLQDVLRQDVGLSAELAGWTLTRATGIAPDGRTITGEGVNPQGQPEAWRVRLPLNEAPVLVPIGDRTVQEGELLTFTARATDANAGQTRTYSLAGQVPAGMVIDAVTGVFTYTPTVYTGPVTFTVDVVVMDNGLPQLSDRETIRITVQEPDAAFFQGLGELPGGAVSSAAAGVSADGNVVVGQSDVGGPFLFGLPEAFRWTAASGLVGLGQLPGDNASVATGTSADGMVVAGTSITRATSSRTSCSSPGQSTRQGA